MLIVMGDVNAIIGGCNEGYEEIMGKEGLGKMNNNGERFVDFCTTQFGNWRKHLQTQTDPQGQMDTSKPHKCETN